jgi:hypothetical protein
MIKASQFKFYVFQPKNPKKKCLTPQQRKIKDLSAVTKKCLTKEASNDKQSLFQCIFAETGRQLQNL